MPCQASSPRFWIRSFDGLRAWLSVRTRRATLLLITAVLVALAVASAIGCARTVLVSEGSPIRIGPEMTGRVYTKTDDGWQLSDNRVRVPEGWYCVPPSYVEAHQP